jgi:hypothetical protein
MLKHFHFKQPAPDYCKLCQKLVHATFSNDFRAIRKLVAYDFEELRPIEGQIGGRDGYLQHSIGMRQKYPNHRPNVLSCEYYLTDKGSPPRELYKLRFKLLSDSGQDEGPAFEWTVGFSRKSKLVSRRCHSEIHKRRSDNLDNTYPEWLHDKHLAPPTWWDRIGAGVANLGDILFALRPLILITLMLYVLIILPPQSEEALRVMVQENRYVAWVIVSISAWVLTYSMFMYGHGAFTARPLNAKPNKEVSTLRHATENIVLLLVISAMSGILIAAPLLASPSPDIQFANGALTFNLYVLAGVAAIFPLWLLLPILKAIIRDVREKNTFQRSLPHSEGLRPIRTVFVFGLIGFFLPYQAAYQAVVAVVFWAVLVMAMLSWMAWLSTRSGLPLLFIAFAVPALLSWSNANDHHTVRHSITTPAASPAKSAFDSWLKGQPNPQGIGGNFYPVFIVAAEGGGLRAAVMTAMVLDELRARFPCSAVGAAPVQCFQDNLFAMIGVSGGSVGTATFAAALHDDLPPRKAMETLAPSLDGAISIVSPNVRSLPGAAISPAQPDNWQAALHADLLSPTVRSMLSLDLLGHYVPSALLDVSVWDRSRALEDAWAQGWKEATGRDSLRKLMFSDVAPLAGGRAPNLILLTTSVEDGEPVAISHLTGFGIRTLSEVAPEIDVPLTTAAVMSARFPVITTAALLPNTSAQARTGRSRGYVDGGYFENSGLTTATKLIKAIQPKSSKPTRSCDEIETHERQYHASDDTCVSNENNVSNPNLRPELIVIRIENGGARQAVLQSESHAYLFEFMSPFSTFYKTLDSRGRQSAEAFQDFIDTTQKACVNGSACYPVRQVRFALEPKGSPIPLGWLLSSEARQNIATQLSNPCNEKSFDVIGQALGRPSQSPK